MLDGAAVPFTWQDRVVRVLLAPTSFVDPTNLPAAVVAQAWAAGWAQARPADQVTCHPLSDGGIGWLDALAHAWGAEATTELVTVPGPIGEPTPVSIVLHRKLGVLSAYVEAAQAVGPHLMSAPGIEQASSFGLGQVITAALATGAGRVVVGVGPAACHDAGAGLLAGLGLAPGLRLPGTHLAQVQASDFEGLAQLRDRLRRIELVVVTPSPLALTGFGGACAELRGVSDTQSQQLERDFGRFAELAQRALVAGRPLIGRGLAAAAGSGAGGGIGFALLLLGARHLAGVATTLELTGFGQALAQAELVVTGEQTLGWQSVDGVVAAVAAAATELAVPAVAIAGEVELGRRELLGLGIQAAYPALSLATPATEQLRGRAGRVARTWSPSP